MKSHYCLNDSYPNGRIVCLCVRGVDHDESLFDVPRKSHTEVIDSENPGEGPRVVTVFDE